MNFRVLSLILLTAGLPLIPALRKCTRPAPISHATVSVEPWETEFVEGTQVKYTCDQGYQGEGNDDSRCVFLNGRTTWTEPGFSCAVISKSQSSTSAWTRFKNWLKKMACNVVKSAC